MMSSLQEPLPPAIINHHHLTTPSPLKSDDLINGRPLGLFMYEGYLLIFPRLSFSLQLALIAILFYRCVSFGLLAYVYHEHWLEVGWSSVRIGK